MNSNDSDSGFSWFLAGAGAVLAGAGLVVCCVPALVVGTGIAAVGVITSASDDSGDNDGSTAGWGG
jgi:hypothetical protein